jgi:hypothetical protein
MMSFVKRRHFLWIIFFGGIVLAAVVANATTLSRIGLDELARQATAVARVRCLGSESKWDGGEIWTETKFVVLEQEKGLLNDTVMVRLLGGRVANLNSHVDGVPVFRAGEEVYLFLWGKEGEPYRVLGWGQGTFRIARDGRSGVERVTQESAYSAFNAQARQFHGEGIRGLPLAEFHEKLRTALHRQNH